MAKEYNDEFDVPRRKFNNDSEGLYRAQEIVSPYPVETGRYEKKFLPPKRRFYKRDKDFTPAQRAQILARVSEVGATRAADEFGTRRWVIMQWLDNLEKFGSVDNPNDKSKNQKYKNKKRGFEKQNFEHKKFSPRKEAAKHEKKSEVKEIEEKIPDFQDFKFNFDDILSQEAAPVETQEKIPEKLKTSDDFTLEERRKILELSDEIGIKNAALQVHTKIDVIKYWRKLRKNAAKIQPKKTSQPVETDPLVAENEILKAKIADLEAEEKKLTEKVLMSIG